MNAWIRWMDGWMDGWMNDEWMDECMDGWMNVWMDEWMDGWIVTSLPCEEISHCLFAGPDKLVQ